MALDFSADRNHKLTPPSTARRSVASLLVLVRRPRRLSLARAKQTPCSAVGDEQGARGSGAAGLPSLSLRVLRGRQAGWSQHQAAL